MHRENLRWYGPWLSFICQSEEPVLLCIAGSRRIYVEVTAVHLKADSGGKENLTLVAGCDSSEQQQQRRLRWRRRRRSNKQ